MFLSMQISFTSFDTSISDGTDTLYVHKSIQGRIKFSSLNNVLLFQSSRKSHVLERGK